MEQQRPQLISLKILENNFQYSISGYVPVEEVMAIRDTDMFKSSLHKVKLYFKVWTVQEIRVCWWRLESYTNELVEVI